MYPLIKTDESKNQDNQDFVTNEAALRRNLLAEFVTWYRTLVLRRPRPRKIREEHDQQNRQLNNREERYVVFDDHTNDGKTRKYHERY